MKKINSIPAKTSTQGLVFPFILAEISTIEVSTSWFLLQVVKDCAFWLLYRLIALELKYMPREWVGGNVTFLGEVHR